MARDGHYIIEFFKVGSYVKVSAIDPRTLVETCIIAPSKGVSKLELERLAVKKLERTIKTRQSEQNQSDFTC